MIGLDSAVGEEERIKRLAITGGAGSIDLMRLDLEATTGDIDPVKSLGQLDQSFIASHCNIGNDGSHGCLDLGHGLALGREERAERDGEVGSAAVETDRHCLFCSGCPDGSSESQVEQRLNQ